MSMVQVGVYFGRGIIIGAEDLELKYGLWMEGRALHVGGINYHHKGHRATDCLLAAKPIRLQKTWMCWC